jgi:hypothetical protein
LAGSSSASVPLTSACNLQAAAVKLAASDLDARKTVASSVPKNEVKSHEGRNSEKFPPPVPVQSLAKAGWTVASR